MKKQADCDKALKKAKETAASAVINAKEQNIMWPNIDEEDENLMMESEEDLNTAAVDKEFPLMHTGTEASKRKAAAASSTLNAVPGTSRGAVPNSTRRAVPNSTRAAVPNSTRPAPPTTHVSIEFVTDDDFLRDMNRRAKDSATLKARLENVLLEVDPLKAEMSYWGSWLAACCLQCKTHKQWLAFREESYQLVKKHISAAHMPTAPGSYLHELTTTVPSSGPSRYPSGGLGSHPSAFSAFTARQANPPIIDATISATGSTFGGHAYNTNQTYAGPSFTPEDYGNTQDNVDIFGTQQPYTAPQQPSSVVVAGTSGQVSSSNFAPTARVPQIPQSLNTPTYNTNDLLQNIADNNAMATDALFPNNSSSRSAP